MAKSKTSLQFESEKQNISVYDEVDGFVDREFEVQVIPDLNQQILAAVEADPRKLEMMSFHGSRRSCGTTHCIAGWAVTVAGPAGKRLERQTFTEDAAVALFKASLHGEVPDFFCSNEEALDALRRRAAEEAEIIESAKLGLGL